MNSDSSYLTDYSPHHNTLVRTVTGSNSGKRMVRRRTELWVGDSPDPFYRQVSIGTLPDDVLLEIFHFYVTELHNSRAYSDGWRTLVHVCHSWRNSREEDIEYLAKLPIVVYDSGIPTMEETDSVVAALEFADRVTRILLQGVPTSALERFAAAMQVPFPALTHLDLWWDKWDEVAPVISDRFLGGSASRLQSLALNGVQFPALPKLLLSATDLSYLELWNIPHSSYISPEEMVRCLSTLTRLGSLALTFRSPRSRPSKASRPPRPTTRAVFPSLTYFQFRGVTEYLEDLVARMDAPLLEDISIRFFNQLIFDIFRLPKFLNRTPQVAVFDQTHVVLYRTSISVILSSLSGRVGPAKLNLTISCSKLEWQLSSLLQVCGSIFSTLSHSERLDIREHHYSPQDWQDDIENSQWPELLQPFSTVKDLHISNKVISHLSPALQELSGERATEVLPALQNLYMNGPRPSGPVQEAITQFIAARQLSGQPVAVHFLE